MRIRSAIRPDCVVLSSTTMATTLSSPSATSSSAAATRCPTSLTSSLKRSSYQTSRLGNYPCLASLIKRHGVTQPPRLLSNQSLITRLTLVMRAVIHDCQLFQGPLWPSNRGCVIPSHFIMDLVPTLGLRTAGNQLQMKYKRPCWSIYPC